MTTDEHNRTPDERAAAAFPLAAACASIVFFLYIYLFSFSPLSRIESGLLGRLNGGNILKYVLGLALFGVSLLLFGLLGSRLRLPAWLDARGTPLSRKAYVCVFAVLAALLAAYLLFYYFVVEPSGVLYGGSTAFPWRHLPYLAVPFALCAAGSLTVLQTRSFDLPRAAEVSLYVAAIILAFFAHLYFNMPDAHHGTAYVESILNVYDGVPYDLYTTGIYGHYALFYAPLLRLCGGSAAALFVLIALVGAAVTAACVVVVRRTVANRFLRVAAVYASLLTVAVMRGSNYWQIQPHRVLFPLLLAAYLCAAAKKNAWSAARLIGGFALCTAAVIWNVESGLFCVAGLIVAWVVRLWQTERWCSGRAWRLYAALIGGAIASAAVAILTVNLYNLACGGTWILRLFFFPMFENSYMNGVLKVDLPAGVQVWALVLILFFLLLCYGLYHTALVRRRDDALDPYAPVLAAIAVLGLLQYSYYANRAAYFNLDICVQLACLAMAAIADRLFGARTRTTAKTLWQTCGQAVAAVCVAVLGILASQTAFIPEAFANRAPDGSFSIAQLNERTAQLEAAVPEDYLILGCGSSVLLRQAGRTPIHHYRDLSDLTVGGDEVLQRIVRDVAAHGKVAFFIAPWADNTLMEAVLADADYVLVSESMVGTARVLCYRLAD